MIVQKDFNFSEEFYNLLGEEQASILRRASVLFKDERVIWDEGAKTWLVLDCLAEQYLKDAERQVVAIEVALINKPEGTITVKRNQQALDTIKKKC